jgi:hypothetical protein
MNKILALWATPRSTSTAFERVMSNRGDMRCFHEPYNEAYYRGKDRRNDRYYVLEPDLEVKQELTVRSVHQDMARFATTGPVFVKDFAYSIIHIADDAFLDSFTHTFLIRDPAKVITSMHTRWPDISLSEIGFEDLYTLFTRIADREGKAPPVIDSDEMLSSPNAGMARYCEATGITFIEKAMEWEKRDENPTWNTDIDGFHSALRSSTSLNKQPRNYPPLESSAAMMRLYEASKPYYDALYKYQLTIDKPDMTDVA